VLVNYWAKWCKPCIKEIPELNALDQGRDDVTVLGVNYDGLTGDALAAQLTELKVEFATLTADPATQLGTQRPVVLPTTFILDPEGALVSTLVGPQTLETLEQALVDAGGPAG
jgi:thiol-disulfide isomerase/thioredoxin